MSDIFFPIFMSGKKDSNWYLKIPPSGKSSWKPLNISYNSLSSYLEKTYTFPDSDSLGYFTPYGSPSSANHPGSGRTSPGAPEWCWEPRPLSWILWRCQDMSRRSPERGAPSTTNNYLPAAHGPSQWSGPRYSVEIRGLAWTTCQVRPPPLLFYSIDIKSVSHQSVLSLIYLVDPRISFTMWK